MNKITDLPITFLCTHKKQTWEGLVTRVYNYDSHYEIHVQSRSSIIFMIGKYTGGGFISVPAFNAGSDLASFSDYFWNCERISLSIGKVDAITIAEAIRALYKAGHIK
jgi:hypothetical protein